MTPSENFAQSVLEAQPHYGDAAAAEIMRARIVEFRADALKAFGKVNSFDGTDALANFIDALSNVNAWLTECQEEGTISL
jgi:hypothetical protein